MIEIYDPKDLRKYFAIVADVKPGNGGGLDRYTVIIAPGSSQWPKSNNPEQEQELIMIRSHYTTMNGQHNGSYWKPMSEEQKSTVFGAAVADAQMAAMSKGKKQKVSSLRRRWRSAVSPAYPG
eukprot:COSAG04_NODE_3311_length_2947_cov_202.139045_2_plen_123_part_00